MDTNYNRKNRRKHSLKAHRELPEILDLKPIISIFE